MTKLIEQVKPEQFVSYGTLKVAFYDPKNPSYNERFHDKNSPEFTPQFKDVPKYLTYVHILLTQDDRSIVQRAAGNVRIPDGKGGTKPIPEIEAYKRAYDIYLELKNSASSEDSEAEKLKAEIAALKQEKDALTKAKKPVKDSVVEKLSEK